ncbi:MAG: hypothetical protein WCQ95_02835 [Bacteroidota bacterium]
MKEKDVISDYKVQKYILYAEKNDGSYGTVEGGSYIIENDLPDFWHKKSHLEKTMRQRLLDNEITPIHYFMVLEEMTVAELASRAGISKGKVKCHLNPKKFHKTKVSDLQKYAAVFNIPMANFFQILLTSTDQNPKYHFYFEEETQKDKYHFIQTQTNNPTIIITKVEERK